MTPSQNGLRVILFVAWCSVPLCQLLNLAPVARHRTTCIPILSITHHHMHVHPYWRLSDRMWNASSFLCCYTVKLQLPTDACLLPGNQHSISPSTFSPQTHTCADTHRHTHGQADTCAHKYTLPSLTSQQLRFWRGRKSLLTAAAVFLPFCCWSSLFFCLFQHFSQSLKSCCFPGFCLLKEHWLLPF